MRSSRKKIGILTFLISFILLTVSACEKPEIESSASEDTYPVAVIFEDFYTKLGGEDVLGPAISNVFSRGDLQYQFTVNALMVYDPSAIYSERYQLAPIALDWGIEEPPEQQPDDQTIPYINGHQVWEEVQPYYRDLGGFLIGSPLTGMKYNEDKRRYEQYFSNLGFYRNESDEPGMVHLMPYGDWFCADKCSYEIQDAVLANSTDDLMAGDVDQFFIESAKRLGAEFTGPAISETLLARDGNYEKAFKNVVLYSPPDEQGIVSLRPLPQLVGILPDPPVPPSEMGGMYFYQVQDSLGYNVPQYFLDYIALHGSMELSGPPITELRTMEDGSSRQCFTNYCLDYYPNAPESTRVQPVALGSKYIEDMPLSQPKVTEPADEISLQAWERYPLLPSGQSQEIGVEIDEGGVPLEGMEFSLTLRLPDGSQRTYHSPPTSIDGQTSFKVDPIEAPNGSSIPYEVCAISILDRPVCLQGIFLIWDNP